MDGVMQAVADAGARVSAPTETAGSCCGYFLATVRGRITPVTGLVDIHAHILPGIDDGPDDLDGSIAMAQAAVDAGITTLAATPHLRSDFPRVHVEEIAGRVADLQAELGAREIPLQVVSGAETSLIWALEASDEELRLASYAQRGKDLLIETPSSAVGGLGSLLYQVRVRGYRVTLAHPERSHDYQRDPAALYELNRQGVLVEVNAESLLAHDRRSGPGKLAERLCLDAVATALASDGHRGSSWRPVSKLPEAADLLARLVGAARAEWMTRYAPGAVVAGEPIGDPPAGAPRERPRWSPFGRR